MIVTGTFLDAESNPLIGISVTFELDNFGSDMPRLQGSSVIVPLRFTATTDVSGSIGNVLLAGNDTITPAGTTYHAIISGLYEQAVERDYYFSGASADISGLTPEDAVPAAAPPTPSAMVDLAPSAAGNFQVAHGLGRTPVAVIFQLTSQVIVSFQPAMYDGTYLYLVSSAAGSGKALVY